MDQAREREPAIRSQPDSREFGALLRQSRRAAGLTQDALAEQAKLSARGIADIERGARRFPYAETVERLARALGLTGTELANFEATSRRPSAPAAAAHSRDLAPVRLRRVPARNTTTNLPAQISSFVDRPRDMAEVRRLLATSRIATLAGPGGTGKTRLALAIAGEVMDRSEYPDGVWLAELAPVGDALLVPGVVAASVRVTEQSGRAIGDTLREELRSRALLLVLDNCEHVVGACAALVENLLRNCPGLRVLATSREPLRIPGERVWRVPPLPTPDPRAQVSVDELAKNPAVRLFMERGQAVQSRLALTAETSQAIVGICARLDGLPLAIELAAARSLVLTPDQILNRLDDAFRLLVGGSRTAPDRQQTLRATLDWSYVLLTAAERQRFEQLAVFAGGFDLNGAEAIWSEAGEPGTDALEMLTELVDRSLVMGQSHAGGVRFQLLEPVRLYAQERLAERGAWESARRRHADYFLELAEQGEEGLKGVDPEAWVARLELEHDNVRAVLRRCLDAGESETVMRFCSALRDFWRQFGHRNEGRRWLEDALALASDVPPRVRGNALQTAAEMAYAVGDFRGAKARFAQAADHWRGLDDRAGLGTVLGFYGRNVVNTAQNPAEYEAGKALMLESIALNHETGRLWWAARAMHLLGVSAWEHAELDLAAATLGEGEAIFRQLGASHAHSHLVLMLGGVLCYRKDLVGARRLLEQSLAQSLAINCWGGVADALYFLAELSRVLGDAAAAARQALECLLLEHRVSQAGWLVNSLELLGGLACDQGQPERTPRLLAAAAALRQDRGVPMPPILRPAYERDLATARGAMGAKRFAAAWTAGLAMTVDQLVEDARQTAAASSPPQPSSADPLNQQVRQVIAQWHGGTPTVR